MNPRSARPVRTDARRCARDNAIRRALVACACAAMAGCHGNQQAYRDLYYREMRLQEDEIYRLEDCIQEYQGIIRGYRVEVEQLKEQLAQQSADGEAVRPPRPERSLLDPQNGYQETRPPRDEPEFQPPGIDVPEIDLGEPAESDDFPATPEERGVAPEEAPDISVPPLDGEPGELPPPLDGTADPLGEAPEFKPAPESISASAPVAEIELASYAGPPVPSGEATLIALVQPIDPTGAPTRFSGAVSLMLLDPSDGPDGEKIVRWDFTSGEVADSWRTAPPTGVLDLAVVLPEDAPRDRKLELWVRLVDELGGKSLSVVELTLGRLASIDEATFAQRSSVSDGQLSDSDAQTVDWRTSSRPAEAVAHAAPADSGWRRSDALPPPRRAVEPAAFEAPPEAQPVPLRDSADPGPPGWSPER